MADGVVGKGKSIENESVTTFGGEELLGWDTGQRNDRVTFDDFLH